ncbi:hypothetical protein V1477_017834 [Vespula maculifrons]|uniref:Ribosomal protein S3 n=1 Tax=Vespula maculifrons TaxID=7453 RepID=A0ABD2B1B2_VESMC
MEKKYFSLTIFFSETIAPRRTGVGSLERARHALYAHIFFVQIGLIGADTDENRSGVIGKGPPRPVRTYFFRPDRTNRGRVITHLEEPERGHWKGLVAPSTPEPSYNGLNGTKEKNIVFNNFFLRNSSTQENLTAVIGKDSSRPLRPYFFRPDLTNRSRVINRLGEPDRGHWKGLVAPYWTNRSRVITHPGEPVWGHWKGLVGPCTHIFFSSRSDQQEPSYNGLKGTMEKNIIGPIGADTQENRAGVVGKGSSRPLRPYFFRPDRTNRSRVITEPSYNGLKVTKEKKHFSLTIFFSETIAPRRTGLGSLERARRALYAHIFFVQIEPIGADTQENRSWVIGKGSSRPVRIYFFRPDRTNRSQVITKNLNGVIGKDSSRPLRPYFFRPDRTNRSQVITHLGEPDRSHSKGLARPLRPYFFLPDRTNRSRVITIGPIGADTQENRTGVVGKGSSRPLRPYFFRPDRTNRSRLITHLGEPDRARRRTGLGSLERARRALYAHIFFVQIGAIGAMIQENPSGVIGKASSRPLRPYFFLPDWTNRSRVITKNLNGVIGKDSSRPLRPYFFRPDRTNRSQVITDPGEPVRGHWKGLVAPSTPIFFSSRSDQQKPSYNGLKVTKEKKHFSLIIFFSETVAPRRT